MDKKTIIRSFYQGKDEDYQGAGNCASIAVIKAAIYTFGFDVFDYTIENDTYFVKLKNNDKITFTKQELGYASKESSFIQGKAVDKEETQAFKKIQEYAHICFTVICKMAQIHGDFSQRFSKFIIPETFEIAVETINDGAFTPEVYEFLGLEDYVTPVIRIRIRKRIRSKRGMVVWTGSHAMFAAGGYIDVYGKPVRFRNRFMIRLPGNFISGLFQIKA